MWCGSHDVDDHRGASSGAPDVVRHSPVHAALGLGSVRGGAEHAPWAHALRTPSRPAERRHPQHGIYFRTPCGFEGDGAGAVVSIARGRATLRLNEANPLARGVPPSTPAVAMTSHRGVRETRRRAALLGRPPAGHEHHEAR